MITRCDWSTSRIWRITAANARASASQLFWLNVESVSRVLPSPICARGKRSWSAFTHAGAKLERPFFQLPNHTRTIRSPTCLASSIIASTILKSYLPCSGSTQFQPTAIAVVFWCPVSVITENMYFRYSRLDGALVGGSAPRMRNGSPSTINCVARPRFSRWGMAESAGPVCAYAAEIARAQTTAPLVRIESVMMSLLLPFNTSST